MATLKIIIDTHFSEDLSTLELDNKHTWGYTLKSLCAEIESHHHGRW